MHDSYDIVGFGALNTDFIIKRSKLPKDQGEFLQRLDTLFDPNSEEKIPESEADEIVKKIDSIAEKFLAGSAFNVIQGLANINIGINLGFVGIAGSTPKGLSSYQSLFNDLHIDYSCVTERLDMPSGRCISYVFDQDRSLRVAPGANEDIVSVLKNNKREIIATLKKTRLIHLTSFMSEGAPEALANFISEVKSEFPAIAISFDPGHDWCKKERDSVLKIASNADYIFLNHREFELLGDTPGSYDERIIADRILGPVLRPGLLIVLKQYEQIILFNRFTRDVQIRQYSFPRIDPDDIIDDTGAGDAFAAGFLLCRLLPNFGVEDGLKIGMAFAQQKLRSSGSSANQHFRSLLIEHFADRQISVEAPGVTEGNKQKSLPSPSTVTLKWLYEHVPVKLVLAAVVFIIVVFGAGVGVGKLGLIDYAINKFSSHEPAALNKPILVPR